MVWWHGGAVAWRRGDVVYLVVDDLELVGHEHIPPSEVVVSQVYLKMKSKPNVQGEK